MYYNTHHRHSYGDAAPATATAVVRGAAAAVVVVSVLGRGRFAHDVHAILPVLLVLRAQLLVTVAHPSPGQQAPQTMAHGRHPGAAPQTCRVQRDAQPTASVAAPTPMLLVRRMLIVGQTVTYRGRPDRRRRTVLVRNRGHTLTASAMLDRDVRAVVVVLIVIVVVRVVVVGVVVVAVPETCVHTAGGPAALRAQALPPQDQRTDRGRTTTIGVLPIVLQFPVQ